MQFPERVGVNFDTMHLKWRKADAYVAKYWPENKTILIIPDFTLLIYTAESTGASMERRKMPNLPNGTKGGFEPGLTRLRVRHSTTELPRSTYNASETHDGSGNAEKSKVVVILYRHVR